MRKEFERILRFWFDRSVAGFRIDVANALVKDREPRDDVPACRATRFRCVGAACAMSTR